MAKFEAGHKKLGGRTKGTPNKGAEYVERVKKLLKEEKGLTFEKLSMALLSCGNPVVIQKELQLLREYAFGKPKESIEHSGQVATVIWDVPRPARERT